MLWLRGFWFQFADMSHASAFVWDLGVNQEIWGDSYLTYSSHVDVSTSFSCIHLWCERKRKCQSKLFVSQWTFVWYLLLVCFIWHLISMINWWKIYFLSWRSSIFLSLYVFQMLSHNSNKQIQTKAEIISQFNCDEWPVRYTYILMDRVTKWQQEYVMQIPSLCAIGIEPTARLSSQLTSDVPITIFWGRFDDQSIEIFKKSDCIVAVEGTNHVNILIFVFF